MVRYIFHGHHVCVGVSCGVGTAGSLWVRSLVVMQGVHYQLCPRVEFRCNLEPDDDAVHRAKVRGEVVDFKVEEGSPTGRGRGSGKR